MHTRPSLCARQLLPWMCLLLPVAAHADKSVPGAVSWLLASSAENGDAPSTWAWNAVDGKPTTAWCSKGGDVGERLVLGFHRPETITHISIQGGAVNSHGVDRKHARVKELEINDGVEKRTLSLEDGGEGRVLEISPPMQARQLSFIVREVYPAEGGEGGVCIGDILLKSGNQPLTGDAVGRAVRSAPRTHLPLLGPWLDNPSAPERVLTFNLDGTFTWRFDPIMEGKPSQLAGQWDVAGGRITLKLKGGHKPVVLKFARDRMAGKSGTFDTLTLEGTGGHEKLPGTYQPAVSLGGS